MSNLLKNKYIIYGYVIWLLLHIILFIVGGSGYDDGLFPFAGGFNLDNYHLIDFFVYTIAIPAIVFILIDVYKSSETAQRTYKITGIVLLYMLCVMFVYIFFRGILVSIGQFFDTSVLYPFDKEYLTTEQFFDFSGTAESVCTLISIVITAAYAFRFFICTVRCYKEMDTKADEWFLIATIVIAVLCIINGIEFSIFHTNIFQWSWSRVPLYLWSIAAIAALVSAIIEDIKK